MIVPRGLRWRVWREKSCPTARAAETGAICELVHAASQRTCSLKPSGLRPPPSSSRLVSPKLPPCQQANRRERDRTQKGAVERRKGGGSIYAGISERVCEVRDEILDFGLWHFQPRIRIFNFTPPPLVLSSGVCF